MKKILILILLLIVFNTPVLAEYMPQYANPSFYYGNEIISISDSLAIYSANDEKSPIAAFIKFGDNEPSIKRADGKRADISDFLIAYSKNNNIALLPVVEDHDEWYKVLYSQKDKLLGWVKKTDSIDFFSWMDFMNIYGRKNGIYLFRNLPAKYKKLYARPDIESQSVDEFSFSKHISLWLISNNWILVKVHTYDGIVKTGWLQWRSPDNTLFAFPEF